MREHSHKPTSSKNQAESPLALSGDSSSKQAHMLHLQRTIGNRAVQRLIQRRESGGVITIPRPIDPINDLIVVEDPFRKMMGKMEAAARKFVMEHLRLTGMLPKWEQMMRDPKFAAAVEAENDRIYNDAMEQITARIAKENADRRERDDEAARAKPAEPEEEETVEAEQPSYVMKDMPMHDYTPDTSETDALAAYRNAMTAALVAYGITQERTRHEERILAEQPAIMEPLIAEVKGMLDSVEDNRRNQYQSVQRNLLEAIALYPTLSRRDRLANSSSTKGTPAYIRARLDTLYASPAPVTSMTKEEREWADFTARVSAGWTAFSNSNWAPALRGVNNNRQYRAPDSVKARLRRSGGSIMINGAIYTISHSNTAGVSLHRSLPTNVRRIGFESYIFHL